MVDSHDSLCWSQALKAVDPCCTNYFAPATGPIKNKFCNHCRAHGLRIPASRLMVMKSWAPMKCMKNSHGLGLWTRAKVAGGGIIWYRIANNNRKVSGSGQFPVIIFREEPPQDFELVTRDGVTLAPELSPVPECWIIDGCVQLAVTHATLSPVLNMKVHVRQRRSAGSCRFSGVTNSEVPIAPATLIYDGPIVPATLIYDGKAQQDSLAFLQDYNPAINTSTTGSNRHVDPLVEVHAERQRSLSDGTSVRTAESLGHEDGNALGTTSGIGQGSAFRPLIYCKPFNSVEWDGWPTGSSTTPVLTPSLGLYRMW